MRLFGLSKSSVDKMEAKRDVKGLIKASYYKKDSSIRIYATRALKRVGGATAIKELINVLKDPKVPPYVREKAAYNLGLIGDEQEAVDALLVALRDTKDFKTINISNTAAAALAKIGGEHAIVGVINALKDQDRQVRLNAARFLGEIGGTRAVDALNIALKDKYPLVRPYASESLKKIGSKHGLSRLNKMKKSRFLQPSSMFGGRPIVDLRSEKEKAFASRAASPLNIEDEEIAQKLAQLSKLLEVQYSSDKTAYENTVSEFRRIGKQLCANGGDERMKLIAYRVQALGGRLRNCEQYWDGICGWMAWVSQARTAVADSIDIPLQ